MDLAKHLELQFIWSNQTFGTGLRLGVLDHMAKEIEEVKAQPNDLMEWVDLIMLALDGAGRAGFTPQQIEDALFEKLQINVTRKWPDHTLYMSSEAIEHLKPVRDGAHQIGTILRYGSGPTALMRVDSIKYNHGNKYSHYYIGLHILDGNHAVFHELCEVATSEDLQKWRDEMAKQTYR